MAHAQAIAQSTQGDSLADILERVLNTGVVIVGDVRIKLCDVELLSIQLRLLICSVEKAQELGIPWWWEQRPKTPEELVRRPSPSFDEMMPKRPPQHSAPSKQAVSPNPGSLPRREPETRTPWEQYRRFQEFQRFQEAERTFEE